MTSTYTEVFGGNTIYPSDVSYLALALVADTPTYWPLDANTGVPVLARVIDVTPTGAYMVLLPDATLTGTGQTVLFNNLGPYTIDIADYDGNTLASISQGDQWQLYLADNSTPAGTWRAFQYGATTAQAQASALAGYGLKATGSTLSQSMPTVTLATDYTIGAADRAKMFVWTGALGTLSLPTTASVGVNFFSSFNNAGEGNLDIVAAGSDLIDGSATLTLAPGDSCTLSTDGTNWYSLGLGQAVQSDFDFTSIDLTGQSSPYTLSGAELNRVAYEFVGVLTEDFTVIVPNTTQQYWIDNGTTGGSYTLGFKTITQASEVVVVRDQRGIYYCNGADFVDADTASISVPISIADGGTGATSAPNALINLGGTSVGTNVFTAASAGAARATLGSGTVGDAVFVSATVAAAQQAMDVEVGVDVQAYNVKLSAFSALTPSAGDIGYFTGSSTMALAATSSFGRGLWSSADAAAFRSSISAQQLNANLTALSGVTSAADKLFYFTGSGTGAVTDLTSVARTFLAQTTQSALMTGGLGFSANGVSLVQAVNYAAMRTLLSLVVGTDVQAWSANGDALAGVTSAADKLFYFTGSGTGAVTDLTSLARSFIAQTTGSAALAAMLTPGSAGNIIYSDGAGGWVVGANTASATAIGDTIFTARTGLSGFVVSDGSSYSSATYPSAASVYPPGLTLTQRTSGFSTTGINSVAYGGGLWVAVGDSGKISTSTDRETWTAQTSGTANSLYGIVHGGGTWVAVGASGTVLTSTDGASWTTQTSGTANNLFAAAYGASVFVAVGASGTVLSSSNGASWTSRTSGTAQTINDVTFGGSLFVYVGESAAMGSSSNGATWTTRTSGFGSSAIYSVTYGDGLFVAGGASGAMTTSPDAITWTSRTSQFSSNNISGLAYGNGLFVAVGANGTLSYSPDGYAWKAFTSGFSTTFISYIASDGTNFVAVGASGKLATCVADTSIFFVPNFSSVSGFAGVAYSRIA